MAVYVVTYDLRNESGTQDYEVLWQELKRLDAHRALDSVWLVNINGTAKQVHDHIKRFVDNDDRLWVSELTKNHWYSNVRGGTNKWITGNPPSR